MPKQNAPWLALSAALLVAGCGGAPAGSRSTFVDREPLPPDTLTVPTDEIGIYGGRFVIGATSPPKTFNGMMSNETPSSDVTERLFVGLAAYDNEHQTDTPMIAKSWDTSPDGLVWTFHLRRGARFSDGHPLTAEDVLFSFAITAPDSYTVVMRAPRPHALLVAAVSSVPIMPKHVLERAFESGGFARAYHTGTPPDSIVTSGPWRIAQVVPGEKVVLTRNAFWFGVDARGRRMPYLDQLVFLMVPDQNTAALKFKAGDLDALDNVKPEDYRTYEDGQKAGHYRLYDLGPSLNTACLWFNLNRVREARPGHRVGEPWVGATRFAWFDDARFRRAISMAIDRDAIIRSVFFGEGLKNWATMTAASKEWFDPTIVGADHDPEGARRLLAEIGFKDTDGDGVLEDGRGHPVSFTLKTNGDNVTRVQKLNFIKDDLARVGIRCVPQPTELRALVSNLREDYDYEAALLGFGSAVPPDPGMGGNIYRSRGLTHFWNILQSRPATPAEARMDALFDDVVGSTDLAVRKRAYGEIARLWNDQTFTIWLPVQKIKVPVREAFGNVHPTVIPHRVLWNIERVFARHPASTA
jgi:peptide/nickel transport system substrate-binding protein